MSDEKEITGQLFFDDTPDLEEGFPLLPMGQHLFEIVDTRGGTTQTDRGRLGLQAKIIGGEHDGRTGWDNWNLPKDGDAKDAVVRKLWKQIAKIVPEIRGASIEEIVQSKHELLKGLRYRATLTHEEWPADSGIKRNRFKFAYPVEMAPKAPPERPQPLA